MMLKRKKIAKDKPLPKWPSTKFEKDVERFWRMVGKETTRLIDWLLFYKPSDKQDKMIHIIEVLAVLIIIRGLAN